MWRPQRMWVWALCLPAWRFHRTFSSPPSLLRQTPGTTSNACVRSDVEEMLAEGDRADTALRDAVDVSFPRIPDSLWDLRPAMVAPREAYVDVGRGMWAHELSYARTFSHEPLAMLAPLWLRP